ncbi:MAG TPA: hypothetical protein VM098_03855, partial [Phycisphaerae bacterium]|nr:hypothetical protein [Phycisphaerae bacterium]
MKRTTVLVALMLAGLMATVAVAQPPGELAKADDGKGRVILTWEQFVKITGYEPSEPSRKGPQVLTISWKQIHDLLGVKVEGVDETKTVDLPWQDFKALLEWSIKKKAEVKPEVAPPADYIVTSSQYACKVTEDSALVTMTLKLDILKAKDWKRIPVLPAAVAVRKTTLEPEQGVYLNSTGNVYELLTEKTGPVVATIEFSVRVDKSGGINTVSFPRVHPGPSVLDVE